MMIKEFSCIPCFPLHSLSLLWQLLYFVNFPYLCQILFMTALSSLCTFLTVSLMLLDFQFGLNLEFEIEFMQFDFWIYAFWHFAFMIKWIKFFPLCEPGEIPWFAERVNWSQSVALNDEFLLLFIILSAFWLFSFSFADEYSDGEE